MIVEFNQLKLIKNQNIVICAGWFDMFHIGHLNFLKNAKKEADNLIVVVMNDKDGRTIKGKTRPIINQHQRAEIIDSLKYVNYTIISENIINSKEYPVKALNVDKKSKLLWDRYIPIIELLKPNKVFALEETLRFNGLGDYIQSLGIQVIYSDRMKGISTTDIERKLTI